MVNKVKVVADQHGNLIGVFQKNPEKGYIRVEQMVQTINSKGWLKPTKRSALIRGNVTDLEKSGFKAGTELSGKIIIIESLNPFNKDNPDSDLKIAGDTGIVCTLDDQPIYRQSFYTPDLNSEDQFIAHNNTEEIREVMEASRALDALRAEKPVEEKVNL